MTKRKKKIMTEIPIIPNNSPPRSRLGPRVALSLDRSGGANQADAAGADINLIVAQYKKSGTMPRVGLRNPLYGDFTFPEDIHSMREAVYEAEDRFMQLPAAVRSMCDNDWVEFLTKFDNTEEREKLQDAGLQLTDNPVAPSPPQPKKTSDTTPPPDITQTLDTLETQITRLREAQGASPRDVPKENNEKK